MASTMILQSENLSGASGASRDPRRSQHGPASVAVGHTRDEAAATFALDHDDIFLTTLEDFDSEVDLTQVVALDIVPGPGMARLLENASRTLHAGRHLTIRVAVPEDPDPLLEALARNSLEISDVHEAHGSVVLTLGRRGQHRARHDALVLQALAAATRAAASNAKRARPAVVTEAPAPTATAAPASKPRRPQPRLLSSLHDLQRWRRGRRRTATLGMVGVGVLVLVGLGIWTYHTDSLLAVALPALVVLLLGCTALTCYLVLLLARQVHVQTGRLERMALRNRTVVQNRTSALGKQVRVLEEGQARLPFAHDYLEAIAGVSSEASTRLREVMLSLESLGLDAETLVGPHRELHLETQRQVQALLGLERMLDLPGRVSPMGGWAASPDFNLLLVQELLRVRPRTVLECGSGTSTVLMALAVRQYDLPTRIVSLEHLEQFRDFTKLALEDCGVPDLVDVRLAPLQPTSLVDHPSPWYDEKALEDLDDVGLIVVDGPPELTGHHARFPVVPLLRDKFADQVSIVVDDLKRESDHEVLTIWRGLLPEFDVERIGSLQKHAAVLRRGGSA